MTPRDWKGLGQSPKPVVSIDLQPPEALGFEGDVSAHPSLYGGQNGGARAGKVPRERQVVACMVAREVRTAGQVGHKCVDFLERFSRVWKRELPRLQGMQQG